MSRSSCQIAADPPLAPALAQRFAGVHDITGRVLCGGRGSRMGGVDKGLQDWHGAPLVENALRRLRLQVGTTMISANRNLAVYESMGVPVWPDLVGSHGDFSGPLAGWLTGLEHCRTPYLVTVPCDTPNFPADLATRLATALETEDVDIAMAATLERGLLQLQPVFCLMKVGLKASLAAAVHAGERQTRCWTAQHRCATVVFEDAAAFANANTAQQLAQLQLLR